MPIDVFDGGWDAKLWGVNKDMARLHATEPDKELQRRSLLPETCQRRQLARGKKSEIVFRIKKHAEAMVEYEGECLLMSRKKEVVLEHGVARTRETSSKKGGWVKKRCLFPWFKERCKCLACARTEKGG